MSDIVVVDDGRTYVSTETAEVATEAAARAKQWAQESERQANIATSNADIAVQAKDDAVSAKDYAEAAITDTNLVTVATDLQATPSNIKTVSTNISNVNSVASNIANVNAVAGNATNINAVNANKTNIDKVAGDINRVKLVADDIASVHTVAVDISNVIDVASNKANIDTVAGGISDVMSVSTSISNVNAVADDLTAINAVNANKTNINAVNTNKINIDTVAGINTDVSTVAGIASDITTVSSISTDITAVKNNATNISAVNSNKTNIDTVADISSDVTTVASDSTAINTVVNNLTAINNAPTYANNSKIWAEGLDSAVVPLGGTHSSKGWAEIAEQAASGVQNPANRDLSNLSSAGQMKIDSQNGTISNCILEIPQNLKLTLENNVLTLKAGSILTLGGDTYATMTTTSDTVSSSSWLANTRYIILRLRSGSFYRTGFTTVKSGDSEHIDTSAGMVYYNTDNKMTYLSGNINADLSVYPLCLIDVDSNGVASFAKDSNGNDIIFNGWCYMGGENGTTATFVVYPNVKMLRSDGIDSNNKLKSKVYTNNSLYIISRTSAFNNLCIGITDNSLHLDVYGGEYKYLSDITSPSSSTFYYITSENLYYRYTDHFTLIGTMPFIYFNKKSTGIEILKVSQPVRTATVEMVDKIDSSVVHNTGDESIAGHKTFVNTIDYENASNTTNYKGRQYQQSSGDFIGGLQNKTNYSWLNYVQFMTNGSVKFSGTALTIPTPTESTTSSVQADTVGARETALASKQDTLTFDNTPTSASTNPVTSGGIYSYIGNKFQVVNSLPASPDADTFYFIVEQ